MNSPTIKLAAENWISHLQTRKRRPAKPATLRTFRSYLDNHVLPRLGDREVGAVGVAVLRDFISHLDRQGLSAKSQIEISGVVKQIIASVCDTEGEQLYPRQWDNERLDLPIVNPREQNTPVVTREQIEQAIVNSTESYKYLYACLSGSGLRIGEALAVKLTDDGVSSVFDSANAIIHVRRSVFEGQEQAPKTLASVRDVEIPRELAEFVARFAGKRSGFLFGNGTCLNVSTARSHLDQAIPGVGFHSFRRFFVSFRRSQGMPEEILRALVGHSSGNITDRYSRFGKDSAQRREWVEKCGLGFSLITECLSEAPRVAP